MKEPVHPREYEAQATYRAYLFGPFRIFCGERELVEESPRRKKALMILKWFLLNPGKPCSADEFTEMFWPESHPQKALGNFHVTLHCLRRMLESDLHPRQESAFVRRGPNNFYRFDAGESWWTDIGDVELSFERGLASDTRGERRRACFYYRRVASYCAQGFLPEDDADNLISSYGRHYEQMHIQALTRLMQLHMENKEPEELLESAYQMLQVDRCNEVATKVIIDAHLKSGNPAQAQRRLQLFWDSLQRDLQVHPARELYALHARIQAAVGLAIPMGLSTLSSAVTGL